MADRYETSDLEILVSTQNQTGFSFLENMFPFAPYHQFHILVVNQTGSGQGLVSGFPNVRVINSKEKGLSKSRNLALANASKKIVLIADDDVVYKEGFDAKIVGAFNKFEGAVLTFCIENAEGKLYRRYPVLPIILKKKLDLFSILSVEIALKRELVETSNCQFDENFGLGSRFEMGEENIFLYDLHKGKHPVIFVPEIILSHPNPTTNQKIDSSKKYFLFGAFTKRVDYNFHKGLFLKLFFDFKQRKIKFVQLFPAIKSAFRGRKEFINNTP